MNFIKNVALLAVVTVLLIVGAGQAIKFADRNPAAVNETTTVVKTSINKAVDIFTDSYNEIVRIVK